MKKKIFFFSFISVLCIAATVLFYIFWSVPKDHGVIELKNLKSSVKIKKDRYGIPHIYAENSGDAFRALGFIVASERLFQMEMQRRMAFGELSEIFGAKTLTTDKLFRTLGFKSFISDLIKNNKEKKDLNQQMLVEIEAFYDGVNQFQASGNLPIEFKLLNIQPRPFSIVDGYGLMGLMSFSFAISTYQEPLLSSLSSKLGSSFLQELRNDPPNGVLKNATYSPLFRGESKVVEILNFLEEGFTLFEGSNGWLIAASRSESGYPILANDPHITFSHPGVWYESHLVTPDYEMYGHFLPVIPFPVLGHNSKFGWGFTMSLIDDMDLYQEEINIEHKSYRFGRKSLPLKETKEIIKIKNAPPYNLTVRKTHHGPLLDEVLERKSLALSWSFFNPSNDPLKVLFSMGRSRSMQEFKQAVAQGVAPGLNVLYADQKNIAWWIFGEIRPNPDNKDKDLVLDGASGNDEWAPALKFADKPFLENPKEGFIVSANARPQGLPRSIRGDWQPDDRFITIRQALFSKAKWSVEETKKLQTLNFNAENQKILKALLKEFKSHPKSQKDEYKNYVNLLENWDFFSNADSIPASIYYSWCLEITKILLKDFSPKELESFFKLPNSWIFFKALVSNESSVWWQKFDRKSVFTSAFDNTIALLKQNLGHDYQKWHWGRLHTLEFIHPLGKVKPLDLIFNIGPVAVPGAYNEVNNLKHNGGEPFKVKAGPSTRRIIDFKQPERSWGVLPSGNSGHIFSKHYRDQLELFAKGQYRYQWLDEKQIAIESPKYLIMNPKTNL